MTPEHQTGGGRDVPPLPADATAFDALERRSFGVLTIHADNRLTVRLLDPDRGPWTLYFPNADYPSGHGRTERTLPDGLSSENWGRIEHHLSRHDTISRNHEGFYEHRYEL